MVDFKRLSKINQAAQKAIEEEEKHRSKMSEAERRVAEIFFRMGANWQKNENNQ